jgi:hypothetical protein
MRKMLLPDDRVGEIYLGLDIVEANYELRKGTCALSKEDPEAMNRCRREFRAYCTERHGPVAASRESFSVKLDPAPGEYHG